MSVAAAIFYPELKRLVSESEELRLAGSTVGEALDDLVGRFPDARRLLFNSRGDLLRPVHVFVNHEGLRKAERSRPLKDGDTLIIAVLASGG
jgi:molybdopterin converting factor small subunit